MSWERGRADIERLIADGELERVPPSDEVAARLVSDAEAHIVLASKGIEDDPAGALQLSYDAARTVFARLHALRRRRNRTEYPDLDSPGVNADDARQALDTARATVEAIFCFSYGAENLDAIDPSMAIGRLPIRGLHRAAAP